jgi:hypothetical protein
MDSSKIVFLINDQVRLIKVNYEPNDKPAPGEVRSYQFKTLDQTIRVDDLVIVETGTRHGLTVCKVTEVDLDVDFNDGISLKWAFARVDTEEIDRIRASEAEAITAAKRAELKKQRAALRETIFKEHEDMLTGLSMTTPELPAE